MPLDALFHADKALATFPGWSQPEAETGFMWFMAPLEIGGVVETDFVLFGGCCANLPDKNVLFELRVGAPGNNRRIPLARIDWRSVQGGHSNRRRKGKEWSGKRVGATHYHAFESNWSVIHQRMRGKNLPQAVGLEEEPQSFESLRKVVGNLFKINNIGIVSRPPWEYNLFDNG
jgi:hypothetical protein